jgi:LEA14-like dessication related protein
MKFIKHILSLSLIVAVLSGCGINQQAQQIKALENCNYKISGVQQVSVAGTDIRKLINQQDFNIASLPGVALGLLRKDIPLRADLNLEITNPVAKMAAINQFEYKILINNTELATGLIDKAISIGQGQSVTVPVQLSTNIYSLITNGNVFGDIVKAAKGGSADDKLGLLTIKIKPTFMIGGTAIKYPGYITIDKDISRKILL